MNHSEIWKYQKNLIINQEKLSNFSASLQWDYFCPFKRIMYMYIHWYGKFFWLIFKCKKLRKQQIR